MAKTHYYGIIGENQVYGARNNPASDPGTSQPMIMAPTEQLMFAPLVFPSVGDVITQTTILGTVRARVTRIDRVGFSFFVEPMAAPGGAYPDVSIISDINEDRILWDTYSPLEVNGVSTGANILVSYHNSQTAEQLNDDEIQSPTADNVWWDENAQLAEVIEIAGFDNPNDGDGCLPGDTITTPGGSFLCVGIANLDDTADTATVYATTVTGTVGVGDTLTNTDVSRSMTGVTITSVSGAQPVGAWVPYCATPSNGLRFEDLSGAYGSFGSIWAIPPSGNGPRPGLGPDVKIVKGAVELHSVDDPDDTGVRFVTQSSIDNATTTEPGFVGGITLQRVNLNTVTNTSFNIGDTVTCGTWSATVAGFNSPVLYVHTTNGQVAAIGDPVTTSSGGAATLDTLVLGWQKGSKYYEDYIAKVAAAQAATGAQHNGQDNLFERLFVMTWEGELSPYVQLGDTAGFAMATALGLSPETYTAQWAQFAADIRSDLNSPSMPIRAWSGHIDSYSTILQATAYGPKFVSTAVRNNIISVADTVKDFIAIDSYLRGHKMADGDNEPDTDQFMRTLDYLDLGQAMWNGSDSFTNTAPLGNFTVLPVGITAGCQSQWEGSNIFNDDPQAIGVASSGKGFAFVDRDPELWPSINFLSHGNINMDTTDDNLLCWNHITGDLETLDANHNCNTFWRTQSPFQRSGPEISLAQRMKMRYGSTASVVTSQGTNTVPLSGKFAIFKAALGGSCLNPDIKTAPGCWDSTLVTRPSVTTACTVTHSGTSAIITADSGTPFSSYTGDYTIVISGAAGTQGALGRNTPPYSSHNSTVTGNTITIHQLPAATLPDGSETLTISFGPPPLWPELVSQWKAFIKKCLELGYIPRPVWLGQEQGETDLEDSKNYTTHLSAFWTAFEDLCALREGKKDCDVAKFIVQLHQYSPFGWVLGNTYITKTDIDTIRGAQATQASTLSNCVLVDPSALPLEVNDFGIQISSPPYPRTYRAENGIHFTGRAMITKGYMVDAALGGLSDLIPAHPNEAAGTGVAFGAINGTATLETSSS